MNKRKLLLPAVAVVAIAGIALGIKTHYLLPSDKQLSVPKDTRYVITYSTGRDAKENSQINYLDGAAQPLGSDVIDGVTCKQCFQWNNQSADVFTHDQIYFSGRPLLNNEEMTEIYDVATMSGSDQVLHSGRVATLDLTYKLLSGGYTPKFDDGATLFNLLTLYNNEKLYNVPTLPDSCIAVHQPTGNLYILCSEDTGEKHFEFFYQSLVYNQKNDAFTSSSHKLNLSSFIKQYGHHDGVYEFGQTAAVRNSIYQIVKVGESHSDMYLLEISINPKTHRLTYERAYPLRLKSTDRLTCFTTTTVKNGIITYYPSVHPMDIISFDTQTKEFTYTPLQLGRSEQDLEQELPSIRECNGKVYILQTRMDDNKYSISQIQSNGTINTIVSGTFPESRLGSDWRLSDFYCME